METSLTVLIKIIQLYFNIITEVEWFTFARNLRIDWNKVMYLAKVNQIIPLLYDVVNSDNFVDCPVEIKKELKKHTLPSVIGGLCQMSQIHEIQQNLNDNGIKNILHKGMFYSSLCYKSISHREAGDIDIIINKSDIKVADLVLTNLGYVSDIVNNNDEIGSYKNGLDYHLNYKKKGDSTVNLELHWSHSSIRTIIDLKTDKIVSEMAIYETDKSPIWGCSLESTLLLMLTHHSSKEGWTKLKYLCDFTGFLINYGDVINWKQIEIEATKANITEHLIIGLWLVKSRLQYNLKIENVEAMNYVNAHSLKMFFEPYWGNNKQKSKFYYINYNLRVHKELGLRFILITRHFRRFMAYLLFEYNNR